MAKQLNVDLVMHADTSQAKKNLEDLKRNLNEIASIKISNGDMSSDISKAVSAAKDLQMHLNNAMNTKTGNLNLGKLEASLKNSNTVLSTLTTNLLHAGSAGE